MSSDDFIPLEKSWLIRMGVLDIVHGRSQIADELGSCPVGSLGTDLEALLRAAKSWHKGAEINVGESGTLYRFLMFANWKFSINIEFKTEGTLQGRKLTVDGSVVEMSIDELLQLDAHTSQWASAAVLFTDVQRPSGALPYHLGMTFEAKEHWHQRINRGLDWVPRKDSTIARQARAYESYRESGVMNFAPIQAEDYCFARAFGLISASEGERRWPSLRQHESDRIAEMERLLDARVVDSHDHRVVQALAMSRRQKAEFIDPGCVGKTWPQFWDYIEFTSAQSST